MKQDEIMVGIDIGTTKVCAIVAKMNEHDKLEILGDGQAKSEGINLGKVIHKSMTVKAIKAAVAKAEQKANIDIDRVNVGLAGSHIKSLIISGTTTREKADENGTFTEEDVERLTEDVRRKVQNPGKYILHITPQSYMIDGSTKLLNPIGCYGLELEGVFHIITTDVQQVNILMDCIKEAELEPHEFILEPLASGLSVLSEDEKEQGVCLIDIGGGTTDMVIYKDSVIRHAMSIDFGGSIITYDIKEAFNITYENAEYLKVNYGSALPEATDKNRYVPVETLHNRPPKNIPVRKMASIIEVRMQEIIEYIHMELLRANLETKLPGGIVITGGGSALKDIRALMSSMTGLDVKVGTPDLHLCGDVKKLSNPIYATGIGLVMAGFVFERTKDYEGYVENKSKRSNRGMQRFGSFGDYCREIMDKFQKMLLETHE